MHYKDQQNNLHFLESEEHEHVLPPGCLSISDADADKIRADKINPNDAIFAKISSKESTLTPRRLREALIGGNLKFLQDLDQEITALRATLKP